MGSNNKRKTTEQFKDEVFDLVGDKYTVLSEYVNAKTKIKIIHNECDSQFEMTPSNFLFGQRCPECAKRQKTARITQNKKTTELFKQEVYSLVQNDYTVQGEYVNGHTKILFKHNICNNTFKMTPAHFLSGERCTNKECLHSRWSEACINSDNFYKEFEKYSATYEILSEYNGYKNNMKFKHKICEHVFERSPNNFVTLGDRCPKCTAVIYKGENKIEEFLNKKGISFLPQKTFNDLRGVNNGLLSYDFCLPQYNLLIEYQGEQHETPIKLFGGKEQLEIQQEHDKRKREYAKTHGIQLLEIWYWDFENIEKILEETLSKIQLVA